MGSSFDFQGSASDAEDGVLTGSITWSSDEDGALGSGGTLPAPVNMSRGEHVITASVVDPQGASGSASITITIDGPPTVVINTPSDGATIASGASVTFSATGSDDEDNNVNTSLVWYDITTEEQIGEGNNVNKTELVDGFHEVTATVTDSTGQTAVATVTFTMTSGGNTPPTVNIIAPPDNWTYPQYPAITFSANAYDGETPGLNGSIEWTSSLESGILATGSTFSSATLTIGTHIMTASVTDGGGLSATDSITITITADEPAQPDFVSVTNGSQGNTCTNIVITWNPPDGADAWAQNALSYRVEDDITDQVLAIIPANDPGDTFWTPPNMTHGKAVYYEIYAQFSGNFVSLDLDVDLVCNNGVLSIDTY
jgi:hypothetical protein